MLISTDKIKKVPTVLILYSHQVLFFTQQVHTQNTIELLCYSFHQRFVGKKKQCELFVTKNKTTFQHAISSQLSVTSKVTLLKKRFNPRKQFYKFANVESYCHWQMCNFFLPFERTHSIETNLRTCN